MLSRLGTIKSQIGDLVIVEKSTSEELPDIGKAFSIGKNKIGKVCDIIGNVKNPYLVVKSFKKKNEGVPDALPKILKRNKSHRAKR